MSRGRNLASIALIVASAGLSTAFSAVLFGGVRTFFKMGQTHTARSVLQLVFVLGLCLRVHGLTCWKSTEPLNMDTKPFITEDCAVSLGTFQSEETLQSFILSDQEALSELPTCFVSCEGPSEAEASCMYGCTRRQSCLMMEDMATRLRLQERENTDEDRFFEACLDNDEICQPTFYYHSCCPLISNCNVFKSP